MAGAQLTLTVLGASPAFPNAGGACSGYLVRFGGSAVLVDCGSGVVGRLRQQIEPWELDGLAISHLHADHYFDLVPLYYGLTYGAPEASRGRQVPLWLPPGGRAHLRRFGRLVSGREKMFERAFRVEEYAPGRVVRLGGSDFEFRRVQHYVPSFAMRISAGGRLLVFSSDVAPCAELVEAARGADLFLCEAAWISAEEDRPDPRRRGHLTAAEVGQLAREAGAKRLLLTHARRDGGQLDEHHRRTASASFGQEVQLAEEGHTYAV